MLKKMTKLYEKEILIKELLNAKHRKIISMPGNKPVSEAAKLMADHKVGSIIIKNKKISGIITKGDIINRVVGKALDPGIIMVDDVMSHPIFYISSDETLETTMLLMAQKGIERVLVVEDNDLSKPLGILSTNDILKFAPGFFRIRRERLLIDNLEEDFNSKVNYFKGFCDDCANFSEHLITTNGYTLCPDCVRSQQEEELNDDEIM